MPVSRHPQSNRFLSIMEEEYESLLSTPVFLGVRESSDSDDALSSLHPPAKRCRLEQGSPFSSPFFRRGVLQQMFANHRRIWPGTFELDGSATIAYHRVPIKPQRPDTNPPFPPFAAHKTKFQCLDTAAAVLTMTRDAKPIEFLRTTSGEACLDEGVVLQELFRKELTPSDVGKLNRLVIPKKHAVKHFPRIQAQRWGGGSAAREDGGDGSAEGMMLEFKDAEGRSWEFRYCYWKSSQSFVFTKGWNRFVKTKGLQEKDVVAFYRCEDQDGRRKPFCLIDVRHGSNCSVGDDGDVVACALGGVGHDGEEGEAGLAVGLGGGRKTLFRSRSMELVRRRRQYGEEDERESAVDPVGGCQGKKSFMLFGVQITGS